MICTLKFEKHFSRILIFTTSATGLVQVYIILAPRSATSDSPGYSHSTFFILLWYYDIRLYIFFLPCVPLYCNFLKGRDCVHLPPVVKHHRYSDVYINEWTKKKSESFFDKSLSPPGLISNFLVCITWDLLLCLLSVAYNELLWRLSYVLRVLYNKHGVIGH